MIAQLLSWISLTSEQQHVKLLCRYFVVMLGFVMVCSIVFTCFELIRTKNLGYIGTNGVPITTSNENVDAS